MFWVAPLVGALLGGLVHRFFATPSEPDVVGK